MSVLSLGDQPLQHLLVAEQLLAASLRQDVLPLRCARRDGKKQLEAHRHKPSIAAIVCVDVAEVVAPSGLKRGKGSSSHRRSVTAAVAVVDVAEEVAAEYAECGT